MIRYVPARHYAAFGAVALGLSVAAAWLGFSLTRGLLIPAALFFVTSALLLSLALRPAIHVGDVHIEIGDQIVPWVDIEAVDRTGWISPLVVKLSLYDGETFTLIYPGEVDHCRQLLRTLRQMATTAMIDGIPYRQYWGEMLAAAESEPEAPVVSRQRILRPEDEEEVERLYFLLKTVGHIDPRNSGEDR